MKNLTVIILTKNEEKNILDCLDSIGDVNEIIIIDDYSTDRTIEVVKSLKNRRVKIYERHLGLNFSEQRNFGLEKATSDWVLFIDADERISDKLLNEVSEKVKENSFDAFKIKREDYLFGRKLKFGETSSIFLTRLGKRNKGKWIGAVHEVWKFNDNFGLLKNPISHFPHQTISEFISEVDYYSTIRAKELYDQGRKSDFLQILLYTKGKFIYNYILKMGFRDGIAGLVAAIIMSFHSFLVRSKLWLLQKK